MAEAAGSRGGAAIALAAQGDAARFGRNSESTALPHNQQLWSLSNYFPNSFQYSFQSIFYICFAQLPIKF